MNTTSAAVQLSVRDCKLRFNPGQVNETLALRGVSLDIAVGQFVVVLGSNGAGKSTLLNTIAGVHVPEEGSIRLAGLDVTEHAEFRRARTIGRVFQDPLLGTAGPMTIEENLVLAERRNRHRRLRRPRRNEDHRQLLAQLGMGLEDRLTARVDTLSGGQRQALAVLMAMEADPALLLLDEHTAALDPAAATRVLEVTDRLVRERNITTLMITHNMSHATSVGDRTVMLHRGLVLFDIDGEEHEDLTTDQLVSRFHQLGGDDLGDRALLT